LLISHCHRIKRETLFETGSGNNRRILNVNHIAHAVGPDVAEALPAFHSFTGCDTTSSFVRKGKRGPYKLLSTNQCFITLYKDFGSIMDWMTSEKWTEVQQFVCGMYGRPNCNNTNVLRYDLFKSRYEPKSSKSALRFKNVCIDMSLLPPCQLVVSSNAYKESHIPSIHLETRSYCGCIGAFTRRKRLERN
jgi:hypothetical protein